MIRIEMSRNFDSRFHLHIVGKSSQTAYSIKIVRKMKQGPGWFVIV